MDKIVPFIIGFVVGNIINFVELGVILKVSRDIEKMLKQFKSEGNPDSWIK